MILKGDQLFLGLDGFFLLFFLNVVSLIVDQKFYCSFTQNFCLLFDPKYLNWCLKTQGPCR